MLYRVEVTNPDCGESHLERHETPDVITNHLNFTRRKQLGSFSTFAITLPPIVSLEDCSATGMLRVSGWSITQPRACAALGLHKLSTRNAGHAYLLFWP